MFLENRPRTRALLSSNLQFGYRDVVKEKEFRKRQYAVKGYMRGRGRIRAKETCAFGLHE
jgi:hypothetical protein